LPTTSYQVAAGRKPYMKHKVDVRWGHQSSKLVPAEIKRGTKPENCFQEECR